MPYWGALVFVLRELVEILSLMIPLLFAVGAKGGGVLCDGLGLGFTEPGEFSLEVLQVVGLLLDEGHEALVAVREGGVV